MSLPLRVTDGPERVLLENMLDRNRAGLIQTVHGLTDEEARRRLVPSLTTPIALIKHAAAAERIWFQRFLESGGDTPRPGETGSFAVGENETLADIIAEFERASERSRLSASNIVDYRYHRRNSMSSPPIAAKPPSRWKSRRGSSTSRLPSEARIYPSANC